MLAAFLAARSGTVQTGAARPAGQRQAQLLSDLGVVSLMHVVEYTTARHLHLVKKLGVTWLTGTIIFAGLESNHKQPLFFHKKSKFKAA